MTITERFAAVSTTGQCPDCGRQIFDPTHTTGPRAQILAAHDCGPRLAHPVRHTYGTGDTGKAFHTVQCDACHVVLNSGHHYTEVNGKPSPHAVDIGAEHNRKHHGVTP